MATIRITQELKRDILNKINNDHKPITDKHDASFKINMAPEHIYEHALTAFLQVQGVERSTFDGLPESWKDECAKIDLRKVNGVDVPYQYREFRFAKPVYAPDRMKCDTYVDVTSEALQPLADAITAWREESARIEQQHNAFVTGVNKIIAASTTVKQAVEMWPQFIEVLPDSVKARHYEVEVRQKKEKVQIDGDLTDSLSGHLVGVKISKAV